MVPTFLLLLLLHRIQSSASEACTYDLHPATSLTGGLTSTGSAYARCPVRYATLPEAQEACDQNVYCGGITMDNGLDECGKHKKHELRAATSRVYYPGLTSYEKVSCPTSSPTLAPTAPTALPTPAPICVEQGNGISEWVYHWEFTEWEPCSTTHDGSPGIQTRDAKCVSECGRSGKAISCADSTGETKAMLHDYGKLSKACVGAKVCACPASSCESGCSFTCLCDSDNNVIKQTSQGGDTVYCNQDAQQVSDAEISCQIGGNTYTAPAKKNDDALTSDGVFSLFTKFGTKKNKISQGLNVDVTTTETTTNTEMSDLRECDARLSNNQQLQQNCGLNANANQVNAASKTKPRFVAWCLAFLFGVLGVFFECK